MKKTTLLLDINDTLDNGHDYLWRSLMYLEAKKEFIQRWKVPSSWVMPPKEWIEIFWDFLNAYKNKILPIFWTSVWLQWQKYVADKYLKANVVWFDGEKFYNDWILDAVWTWIGGYKSRFIPVLRDRFKQESQRIIWFEDRLCEIDRKHVDQDGSIHHVKMSYGYNPETQKFDKPADLLADKIGEIKRLII